jgi:hypothetical protein
MDHGIAGIAGNYPNFKLMAYRAFSNSLHYATVPVEGSQTTLSGSMGTHENKDLYTTYAAKSIQTVTPHEEAILHAWGFDTRVGLWKYYSLAYDPDDFGWGEWDGGGRFAALHYLQTDANGAGCLIYSGITHSFTLYTPGLTDDGFVPEPGGTVLFAGDDYSAWGYNAANGDNSLNYLTLPNWSSFFWGDEFFSFSRYDHALDRMNVHFYNGPANSWTTTDIWKGFGTLATGGAHVYTISPFHTNPEVLFYSPVLDTYARHNFSSDGSISLRCTDNLALAIGSNEKCLYDAKTGVKHVNNYTFSSNGSLGENVCVAVDQGSQTLYGYSALSSQWTQLAVDVVPYPGFSTNYVGWAATHYTYTKYYAFNGMADAWVELVPSGNYIGSSQGGQTILVIRTNNLYAFDPDVYPADAQEDVLVDASLLDALQAARCYPNPFNAATFISYDLPRETDVRLDVFDLRGRRVATLVDGVQTAGPQKIRWQTNQAASGVYFFKLQAEGFEVVRQMTLVK